MASLLAYILFSCAAAFTPLEPLTDSPSYVIDPLTHTHGVMVSPERIIIKLDCPLCPIYNRTWNSKATALIYDFQIDPSYSDPHDEHPFPPSPAITLNSNTFYPPGPKLGQTPLTAHTCRPVPWDISIDDYVAQPQTYEAAKLEGMVQEYPVHNEHGWNLTYISFTTFAYGTTEENKFVDSSDKISAVGIFLQRKNVTNHENNEKTELRDLQRTKEQWTLEWWQIVPVNLVRKGEGLRDKNTAAKLPDYLREKLLGKRDFTSTETPIEIAQPASHRPFTVFIRLTTPLQILVLLVLVAMVVAFAVLAIDVLLVLGSMLFEFLRRGFPNRRLNGAEGTGLIVEKVKVYLYRDIEVAESPPLYEECIKH